MDTLTKKIAFTTIAAFNLATVIAGHRAATNAKAKPKAESAAGVGKKRKTTNDLFPRNAPAVFGTDTEVTWGEFCDLFKRLEETNKLAFEMTGNASPLFYSPPKDESEG